MTYFGVLNMREALNAELNGLMTSADPLPPPACNPTNPPLHFTQRSKLLSSHCFFSYFFFFVSAQTFRSVRQMLIWHIKKCFLEKKLDEAGTRRTADDSACRVFFVIIIINLFVPLTLVDMTFKNGTLSLIVRLNIPPIFIIITSVIFYPRRQQ